MMTIYVLSERNRVHRLHAEPNATDFATLSNRLHANPLQQPSTDDKRESIDVHEDLLKRMWQPHRCSSVLEDDEVEGESLDSSSEMTAALILAGA